MFCLQAIASKLKFEKRKQIKQKPRDPPGANKKGGCPLGKINKDQTKTKNKQKKKTSYKQKPRDLPGANKMGGCPFGKVNKEHK